MSDVEWDAEDFEPPTAQPARLTDKWAGEDEDESVKDNWDDEDDGDSEHQNDKKGSGDANDDAAKKKKKRRLADIIAEKEAKQLEERERRKKEAEEREKALSPEEKLAEKLRMQKIQEDADLQLANDLVGGGGSTVDEEEETGSALEGEEPLLDGLDISTTAGLESFRKAIISKVRSTDRLEKRPFYVTFVEDMARELCTNIDMDDLKKVTAVLNTLYNEKVKASKPKSKKKGGQKAKLNVGQGAIADDPSDYGYNDYDDFI